MNMMIILVSANTFVGGEVLGSPPIMRRPGFPARKVIFLIV